jgi:hypothetical protein
MTNMWLKLLATRTLRIRTMFALRNKRDPTANADRRPFQTTFPILANDLWYAPLASGTRAV